jgi:hypothetical protein
MLAPGLTGSSGGKDPTYRAGMFLQFWGATEAEQAGPVAGDELVADARLVATRSIDLGSPPEVVWPWLVQMGFGRAGWYSYDWLDNLGRRSATRIHPEWQNLQAGDPIPGGPVSFEAAIVERPRAFVIRLPDGGPIQSRLAFTLAFDLRRVGATGTRLVTRVRSRIDTPLGRWIERWLLGPGDGVMVRRQLLNLQERTGGPLR